VILGHRRLAILDLSPGGHQPMSNEDETVWIVFNGEIYNFLELRQTLADAHHRFRSRSDTEVLLHGYEEWGIEKLLEKLRGMFAFALYDSKKPQLILARDRFGIKPLYYTAGPGDRSVAFASETKALVNGGLASSEIDRRALAGFLLFGSIPAPWTIRRRIRCLPAGHYLALAPAAAIFNPAATGTSRKPHPKNYRPVRPSPRACRRPSPAISSAMRPSASSSAAAWTPPPSPPSPAACTPGRSKPSPSPSARAPTTKPKTPAPPPAPSRTDHHE
jgi:asparagine synthase (glutamine-hydrolysing)